MAIVNVDLNKITGPMKTGVYVCAAIELEVPQFGSYLIEKTEI